MSINDKDEIKPLGPVDSKPRISVNKLAEYMSANSTRRKKIIEECKYPPAFIVQRYHSAKQAVKEYFRTGDSSVIDAAIAEIDGKEADTKFKKDNKANTIKLLESLKDIDVSDYRVYDVTPGASGAHVEIAGLTISVNPDVILASKDQKDIGAVKCSFVKNGLSEESQDIVALLVKIYLDGSSNGRNVNPALCLSLDVFKKRFRSTPSSFKRRFAQVESACEEIVSRWDRL